MEETEQQTQPNYAPSVEKKPFLVISYDDDEEQTLHDLVLAKDEDDAQGIVAGVRGNYAFVCQAYTIPDFAGFTEEMYNRFVSGDIPTNSKQLAEHLGEEFEEDEEEEDDGGESGSPEA
jgi:hypothetical protein